MIKTNHRHIQDKLLLDTNLLYDGIIRMELMAENQPIPIIWDRAIDFNVYDNNGNKWIDMTSGIFVANAGHANPFIIKAIKKQLDDKLLYAYNYATEIKLKFVKKLLDISPDYLTKTILLNTGSESVSASYKIIKQWARRNNKRYIVTFKGSYHGQHLTNHLLCGDKEKASWSGVEDDDIVFIDFPYDNDVTFEKKDLPPHDKIAAFFLETFQGWGAWLYPDSYIKDLFHFSRKIGALVCFDDMQGGAFRLGTPYGFQTYGKEIEPDLVCVGKGFTSSLPLSAVVLRDGIVEKEDNIDIHGTHSGNPICCAAALANINFLSDQRFLAELKRKMEIFGDLNKKLEKLDVVTKVNVRGLISGIIFKDEKTATRIVKKCILNGVLPVLTQRNSIKLAPPLTITPDAIHESMEVINESIGMV